MLWEVHFQTHFPHLMRKMFKIFAYCCCLAVPVSLFAARGSEIEIQFTCRLEMATKQIQAVPWSCSLCCPKHALMAQLGAVLLPWANRDKMTFSQSIKMIFEVTGTAACKLLKLFENLACDNPLDECFLSA